MTAPSTAPLAALLASHPEECAAVLCALCVSGDGEAVDMIEHYAHVWGDVDPGRATVHDILRALASTDVAECVGLVRWTLIDSSVHYAIARVGAAAWLRARVGAPATTDDQRQRAMRSRLHELAAVEERDGRCFEWPIGPLTRVDYCDLIADVCRWQELDVEAEVAAVWGPAGAGVPKGEQR